MPAHAVSLPLRLRFAVVCALFAVLAAVPAAAAPPHSIEILSSAPDQVSGGDALVRIQFPGDVPAGAVVLRNGANVTSLFRVLQVERGFEVQRIVMADVVLPATKYEGSSSRTRFFDDVLRRMRETPGVESAALISHKPLQGETWLNFLSVEGDTLPELARPIANFRFVSPGLFETMGIGPGREHVMARLAALEAGGASKRKSAATDRSERN